ncbi:excalibur calcium-binding domain-containing protein [Sphingobium sp. AM]|nr:excalibur calcium-binding domain-containing protein [Sphingobium sp. AM]
MAKAHPGGLNAEGCHNNRKTGDYHCHRASSAPVRRQSFLAGGGTFPNCSAARAAGAAPVRVGDPGYGRHLDRDGDGIGCE